MNINGINGAASYQALKSPVQKTGDQTVQQAQSVQSQKKAEEAKETSVEKKNEVQQNGEAAESNSINLYA
jgi:hypothetical protein